MHSLRSLGPRAHRTLCRRRIRPIRLLVNLHGSRPAMCVPLSQAKTARNKPTNQTGHASTIQSVVLCCRKKKNQRVVPSKESHRRLDPLVHKIASPTAKSSPGWSTRTFQEMTSSSHTIDHSTNEPLCLACFGVTHYPLCDTAHHLSSMGQFYIGISSVAPSTSPGRPLL